MLVVDDQAMVRETLRDILETGYEVLEATDAATAVDIARVAPVDLVLLDILLPGVNGLEALPQLLRIRPGMPVVIVSGVDRAETAATAMRLGAVDYVAKPFEVDNLLVTVGAALRPPQPVRGAPARQAPWAVALIGCSTTVVAGLGATLMATVHVQSYADPPPADVLGAFGAPAVIVVDTRGHPRGWLDLAALTVDRFAATTKPVMLLDATSHLEARFVLGERWLALDAPFQLAALLDLVCEALPEAPVIRPWRDRRTAAIIEAVAADYAHFDLERLAARVGLAPYYLSRWFRRCAGITLTSYLRHVRLHAARQLHEEGGKKIDRLAPEVGFYDASHLSRAFMEAFGCRPGRRRRAAPSDR